jgi:Flp pilus assembly pilin Flp
LETVEYGVILGLIVVGTIVAIGTLAGWVTDQFEEVQTTVDANPVQ